MKPIHVFTRHCYHSPNQDLPNRSRPEWFDKQKVFENFKRSINPDLADYTVVYDAHFDPSDSLKIPLYMFVKGGRGKVINKGTEAGSFLKTLDYVLSLNLPEDAIVYFLEDDHLHRPGWCEALIEAFELPDVHYVALMDHADKYRDYPELTSKLFVTKSGHWRTVPSTVNTFACRMGTLRADIEIHRKYSENLQITSDNSKFIDLCGRGRVLISAVPGFSAHCTNGDVSPVIDWKKVLSDSLCDHYYAEGLGTGICIHCGKFEED